jgi:hypothetical protein
MKAKKFEQQFDEGIDVMASLDLSKARRVMQPDMKPEYGLSKLKSRKNPYASELKQAVTKRLPQQ